ncbi:eukaryotic translation initiation factor 5-like [Eriocheir sinensis]|uniref:eukaryotic translation initiation factor 5-like n=1 Tax=Eriocheir sinensis TaxID=95602 RepID=UPI0021C67F4A|nr:eukaryotic translation initiation factor 5-like [Eriocheir sinensis]XP_050690969.1 eukaryotic translation initiation factor 5-like [Eriocheir sinensis]XP_050690970.1 eukaryotic translation initiation factor 5-like [Eriocheir sinensis]
MSYNVNRSVMDAFYRYKMPKIMAKVEGKGNGIKTVVVNMVDVAKALGRPPTYPCKYFGCELGAQTQFDTKNDRYIVNGSHDAAKLQDLLDGFIKRFVLCPECENPETVLFPNEKKGIIKQSCKACGYQGMLDMRHKLTTYILKNHPDTKPNQPGTALTKRKERSKKAENGQKDSLRPNSPRADKSDASDDNMNGDADDLDDDWSLDVSEAAMKERQRGLTAGVKNLTVSNDIEKTQSERLEVFFEYCKAKKEEGLLRPGAEVAVFKDIAGEAERLEIKENKAVMVLVELLLDDNIIKQIPQYRILLLLFTHGNPKSQKYFIGAVEKLIELNKDSLLSKVPVIFKAMYDHDVIEEEVLLDWGKKVSKKYVSKETAAEIHAKAQPFLKWLQEAEEEETTEEEEDDGDVEVNVEFDARALNQSLKEQEAKLAADTKPVVAEAPKINGSGEDQADDGDDDDDDDSDLDIDNL